MVLFDLWMFYKWFDRCIDASIGDSIDGSVEALINVLMDSSIDVVINAPVDGSIDVLIGGPIYDLINVLMNNSIISFRSDLIFHERIGHVIQKLTFPKNLNAS